MKICKEVWVFFDEINICEYLGIINEVICYCSIKGKLIIFNLVFIVVCNLYCFCLFGKIMIVGLIEKIGID